MKFPRLTIKEALRIQHFCEKVTSSFLAGEYLDEREVRASFPKPEVLAFMDFYDKLVLDNSFKFPDQDLKPLYQKKFKHYHLFFMSQYMDLILSHQMGGWISGLYGETEEEKKLADIGVPSWVPRDILDNKKKCIKQALFKQRRGKDTKVKSDFLKDLSKSELAKSQASLRVFGSLTEKKNPFNIVPLVIMKTMYNWFHEAFPSVSISEKEIIEFSVEMGKSFIELGKISGLDSPYLDSNGEILLSEANVDYYFQKYGKSSRHPLLEGNVLFLEFQSKKNRSCPRIMETIGIACRAMSLMMVIDHFKYYEADIFDSFVQASIESVQEETASEEAA